MQFQLLKFLTVATQLSPCSSAATVLFSLLLASTGFHAHLVNKPQKINLLQRS
uniref:Uncharacterized protein n=1 Tax=Arundo donax TaxID=35708 RepID=A0A0A9GQG2_ARUDO